MLQRKNSERTCENTGEGARRSIKTLTAEAVLHV